MGEIPETFLGMF